MHFLSVHYAALLCNTLDPSIFLIGSTKKRKEVKSLLFSNRIQALMLLIERSYTLVCDNMLPYYSNTQVLVLLDSRECPRC